MDRVIMKWNLQRDIQQWSFIHFGESRRFLPRNQAGGIGIFSGRHSQSQKLTQYKGFKGF